MCSSTCFLWFFLSLDCPVNDEKREKNPTRWKRWTIALLGTRSTNKEYSEKVALRRNRSRSRRYQQQESSLLTRASSALHSRTPIRSCESARFPSFVVFCYAVDNGGKKIWADEFMRKKPNQSTFFAKTYDYTRAHFCSPHFVRRGVEDLRRYASECEITRTTGTNTLHLFRSFFFGRWRCLGRVLERESALWFSISSVF